MNDPQNTQNALRKVDRKKYSLYNAIRNGGPVAWVSCLIMGFGNLAALQFVKGLFFLAVEVAFLFLMLKDNGGLYWLYNLIHPTPVERIPIVKAHPVLGKYIEGYTWVGEDPQVVLQHSAHIIAVCLMFVCIWWISVRSGYRALAAKKSAKP